MRRGGALLDTVPIDRLLRRVGPMLGDSEGRRVAILARASRRALVRSWVRRLPGEEIHVLLDRPPARPSPAAWGAGSPTVHVAAEAETVAGVLDSVGPFDLVIDLRPAGLAQYQETWAAVAFYLRAGACYVLRPPNPRGQVLEVLAAWAALLGGAAASTVEGRTVRPALADTDDLTRSAVLFPEGLVVVKRGTQLRFLTTEQLPRYLPRQRPDLSMSVLEQLPAGVLTSRATVVSHESSVPIGGLDTELPYPSLQLRHYEGDIAFHGGTLLISGNLVLPDSHRFYARTTPLDYHTLPTWPDAPEFGRSDLELPTRPLPGTYYLLDPQFTGHYGHLMTEVVPRLWGWDAAKRLHPDLKVLTMVKKGRDSEPLLDRLLPAYGIDPDDLVYIDTPVRLESVITAMAMWHNFEPQFAHPAVLDIWERIAATMVDHDAPRWDRIFLTRPPGSYRTCHNAGDVEALFRSHGFEVLRPELFDLAVQAGIFRRAKVIAGWGGSQMFNLMYSADLEQLITLCHESYSARNEHLYSAVRGGRADWFWSAPDRRSFHSDWSFDFERNGADLEKLLASL